MDAFILGLKKAIDRIVDAVAVGALSVLVLVVIAQVISRYVVGRPFTWSEELARYMLVWIVYLFAAVAFRLSRHMGIDFFVLILPDRLRGIVRISGDLLIFGFLVVVLRYGPELVGITLPQTSAALGIPMGLVYLAFPVSAGLMALELLFRLYRRLTGGRP